jgi:hypothetical protein
MKGDVLRGALICCSLMVSSAESSQAQSSTAGHAPRYSAVDLFLHETWNFESERDSAARGCSCQPIASSKEPGAACRRRQS